MGSETSYYMITRKELEKKNEVDILAAGLDFKGGISYLKKAFVKKEFLLIDWEGSNMKGALETSILRCETSLTEEHLGIIAKANYDIEEVTSEKIQSYLAAQEEIIKKNDKITAIRANSLIKMIESARKELLD
jgi:hypothetical protein